MWNTTSSIVLAGKQWNLSNPALSLISNADTAVFFGGNSSISWSYITTNGTCQPTKTYEWGFSSLMLFSFCIVTCFVSILMLWLHYDAWWYSSADRYPLYISVYQDILDLADALRRHYGITELNSMPARTLQKTIKDHPWGVELETDDLLPSRGSEKDEKLEAQIRRGNPRSQGRAQSGEDFLLQIRVPQQSKDGSTMEWHSMISEDDRPRHAE